MPTSSREDFVNGLLPLLPHTYLRLHMHRRYLDEYENIISRAYEVVCGYYIRDPDRHLKYSYCDNGVYHGLTSND